MAVPARQLEAEIISKNERGSVALKGTVVEEEEVEDDDERITPRRDGERSVSARGDFPCLRWSEMLEVLRVTLRDSALSMMSWSCFLRVVRMPMTKLGAENEARSP